MYKQLFVPAGEGKGRSKNYDVFIQCCGESRRRAHQGMEEKVAVEMSY